jgi:fluoride exporter
VANLLAGGHARGHCGRERGARCAPGLREVSPAVLALVGTGFCGAPATFSTFGIAPLVEERTVGPAAVHLAATLVLGTGTAGAGFLPSR